MLVAGRDGSLYDPSIIHTIYPSLVMRNLATGNDPLLSRPCNHPFKAIAVIIPTAYMFCMAGASGFHITQRQSENRYLEIKFGTS